MWYFNDRLFTPVLDAGVHVSASACRRVIVHTLYFSDTSISACICVTTRALNRSRAGDTEVKVTIDRGAAMMPIGFQYSAQVHWRAVFVWVCIRRQLLCVQASKVLSLFYLLHSLVYPSRGAWYFRCPSGKMHSEGEAKISITRVGLIWVCPDFDEGALG